MLLPDTPEDAVFRREFRGWLEANLPADLRGWTFRPPPERIMPWYRRLARRGWIAPHWPREHGGMGASPERQLLMIEELARIGAPDLPGQGLNHIGPLLIKAGERRHWDCHLPPILRGDVIWCQGYSEPGSGSDLASLRTRGVVDGDELVIDGQKIWTTWGHHADWMFALVRTGTAEERHRGITCVLIDMRTPGVTVRPITNIAGDDELAEVFFDGVRVPLDNLVGSIGGGWAVATALLDEERVRLGSPLLALRALACTREVARLTGALDDPGFRDRLAAVSVEVAGVAAAFLHGVRLHAAGRPVGPESSFLKIAATETLQAVLDLQQEAAGCAMGLRDGLEGQDVAAFFLQARRASIYGGTNEIQRNILARRVLGLPG
ncbi:MAG TPA: acyl-CoA dehydrogenase family protein [Azospirillum sp.]|nr:acyl-CoA dehydrogenase family protein [Azospirillum sp.]